MYDDEELSEIREAHAEWEAETLDPTLDRHGERRDRFATVSNHEVDRLYTPADVADIDYEEDLGFPARSRTRGASTRRCTADGRGRCGSSPGSAPPRRRTSGSTI